MSKKLPLDLKRDLEKRRGKAYTELQVKFLDNVVRCDFDMREAGLRLGIAPEEIPHMARVLRDDVLELMRAKLIMDVGEAINTLNRVMTEDSVVQASSKLEAAKQIMDRAGLTRPEKIEVDHKVSGGLFLLPAKETVTIKDIDGEVIAE